MKETLSQRHEREIAASVPNGQQVLASGAKLDRHDVRTLREKEVLGWQWRYELKCTQKKSKTLKLDDWLKLKEYSILLSERPAWVIRFYGQGMSTSTTPVSAEVVVLEMNDFIELFEELVELRARVETP